jgi:hypothetical protein
MHSELLCNFQSQNIVLVHSTASWFQILPLGDWLVKYMSQGYCKGKSPLAYYDGICGE